ncbi:MAG TPA: hypothetical protein VMT69_04160, partial [Kineosporiaceae bacterium]|nr:hypothetical protein [Kineosporiaceae bacterium]
PPTRVRLAVRPAHVAVAILFAGALWIAATPINDIDSYWHVQIGREILQRHTLDGLGQQWLGVGAPPWRTSQWLSEVGMYLAVDRFGWLALPVLRLLTACALFAVYTVTLVRRRQPVASFVVLLLVVIGIETLLQDRPATVSLVFVALLGAACERLWATGRRPSLVVVAVATLVWAQLHGLWVLAPPAFLLVALGGLMDRRHAPAGQIRGALLCAAASMVGTLNPQGLVSFLLPIRFKDSAGLRINEWVPTQFTMALTISWGLLLCLVVLAWARSPRRVPATELLWFICWSAFGMMALRNVGPAMLLTAPVALRALEAGLGPRLDRHLTPASSRETRVLAVLVAVLVVLGAAGTVGTLARIDPLHNSPALAIARRLAATDRTLRVWNAYNTSGPLIAFGGAAQGHLKLVVDGRSDLWGSTYIGRTVDAQSLAKGWRQTFEGFRPDVVVLGSDTPLALYLHASENWRVALTDGEYELLVPPGRTL